MSIPPLQALPIEQLRQRSSTKWRKYPPEVLPLFVAETDFPLAPAITERLARAVELGDTGYTPPAPGLREAFVGFADRRFGWAVEPEFVFWTGDVMMGVVEILRRVTDPGDRVIVMPPIYPPFFDSVEEAGAVIDAVPLAVTDDGWRIDLPGVETALAGGARAVLLCNPHNPTGTVHTADDLAALAALAGRYGAVVVSDEIHGPLTHPDAVFTPFLTASDTAKDVGFVVTSPSKAFNLAGLKCAFMIAGTPEHAAVIRGLPWEVEWRTGLFGAIASIAALEPVSDPWLDSLRVALDENRMLLADLLDAHVPGAVYRIPQAGYLGWVDLTTLGWGDNPAKKILDEAAVAVHLGPLFGEEGRGHIRINFACAPETLREAVERIGALVHR